LAYLGLSQSGWFSVASGAHDAGNLVKLTFLVYQLISGLCYQPHMPEDDGHSANTCDVESGSF